MKRSLVLNCKMAGMLTAAVLLLTSCKKDNDITAVTEEDAADVVAASVMTTSGGVTAQAADAARIAGIYVNACGVSKDTSVLYTNLPGAVITYSFAASWHWALTCGVTPRFDFSYAGNNIYDAPRVSSNDKVAATLSLTGLEPNASQYLYNLQLTRNGTEVSKVRNKNSFSSLLTITGSNIAINKQTLTIASGTAAVTISGATSGGKTFSFAGTLVFSGNRKGTLTLNSGTSYSIEW